LILLATALVLRPRHIAEAYRLPPLHNEPFDRMLIAQARVEGLTLVTTDIMVARYGSVGLRVVV
jgi:PIN domain nuclease of toxin-antitoxin system